MASEKRFSKRVQNKYNQNDSSKGIKIPAGIYYGFVVQVGDERRMNRVKVHISRFYGTIKPGSGSSDFSPEDFTGAVWCRYMVPIGGITKVEDGGQSSYGLWGQPPDINTEVVVGFSGDSDKGIILGVLPDESRNDSFAGPQGGDSKDGKFTQVTEVAKTRDTESTKPPAHPQSKQLEKQGLEKDKIRGVSYSRPRRDPVSKVLGLSTPSGHALVMDDGNDSGEFDLIRLRTASGAQILMDDKHGLTYIINRDGTSWIEMNKDGDLDVFSQSSINFHTPGDFNVHAGSDINFHADNNVNIRAQGSGGIKLHATSGPFNLDASGNMNLTTGANGNIKVAGSYKETASRIDMNGPAASPAEKTKTNNQTGNKNVTQSVTTRVPEHEPWKGHSDIEEVGSGGGSSSNGGSGSNDGGSNSSGTGASGTLGSNESPSQSSTGSTESDAYYAPEGNVSNDGENTGRLSRNASQELLEEEAKWLIIRPDVDFRVNPILKQKTVEIAQQFGQPLTVVSGFRAPAQNKKALPAEVSQNMTGNALEISTSTFTNRERIRIVELASKNGIVGIGVYDSTKNISFDIRSGSRQMWGDDLTSTSVPSYLINVANIHRSTGF